MGAHERPGVVIRRSCALRRLCLTCYGGAIARRGSGPQIVSGRWDVRSASDLSPVDALKTTCDRHAGANSGIKDVMLFGLRPRERPSN